MKKIIALVALIASLASVPAFAGHTCKDGSYSGSDGSGTCSHHGGEAN